MIGICGGLQMLGVSVSDPEGVEEGGEEEGFSLLPIKSVLMKDKIKRQVKGNFPKLSYPFSSLSEKEFSGYEIHTGRSFLTEGGAAITSIQNNNVFGTYIHGFLDMGTLAFDLSNDLSKETLHAAMNYYDHREAQIDTLSDMIRENLDIKEIYRILGVK